MTDPTKDGTVQGLLKDRAVVVTLIICGSIIIALLVLTLGVLAWYGKDSNSLTQFFGAANLVGFAVLWGKLARVEQLSNGNYSKVLDAQIKSGPVVEGAPVAAAKAK
jgi:hypothetical protein